jgi:hypothetical protein
VTIMWMRAADASPDASFPGMDCVALGGGEIIGRVCRIEHGKDEGL